MNSLAVSSKRVQRFEGKTIERARTCRGYVISGEKTDKLKIAGDDVNLGLCDSRDYFASPSLIVQTN